MSPAAVIVGPMNAHVTMFEIAGTDAAGAGLARFYAEAVGLVGAPHPEHPAFALVPATEGSIAGFIIGAESPFDASAYAVFYVEVDDVDRVAHGIVRHGGRVLAGPLDYGPVRAAHLADPAGNRFAVFTGQAS